MGKKTSAIFTSRDCCNCQNQKKTIFIITLYSHPFYFAAESSIFILDRLDKLYDIF